MTPVERRFRAGATQSQWARSMFNRPRAFRTIHTLRRALDTVVPITLLAAANLWFGRFGTASNTAGGAYLADGYNGGFLPTVIGVVMFLAVRWARPRMGASVAVVCGVLLVFLPGPVAEKVATMLLFAAGGLVLRRRRSRRMLLDEYVTLAAARHRTLAGFKPSLHSALSRLGRAALGAVVFADLRLNDRWPIVGVEERFEAAMAHFRTVGDLRSEAYVAARAMDHLLRGDHFAGAERLARAIRESPTLRVQPAALAAHGRFLHATGLYEQALTSFDAARELAGRRSPALLFSLVAETVVESADAGVHHLQRLTNRQLAIMVWRRQDPGVLLVLAGRAQLLAATDPHEALRRAYQLIELTAAERDRDLDDADRDRIQLARGVTYGIAACCYEQLDAYYDAALCYWRAYEIFRELRNRSRAGRAITLSAVNTLRAGYCDADVEDRVIDLIRVGLQILEEDRGELRQEANRASWVEAHGRVTGLALTALTSGIRHHRAKAAELALWLVESLHRGALAQMVNAPFLDEDPQLRAALQELNVRESSNGARGSGHDPVAEQSDLARLRGTVIARLGSAQELAMMTEPVDLDDALLRLANRVALLYHCRAVPDGWLIHSVLVTRDAGVRARRTHLRGTAAPGSEPLMDPAGMLSAIAGGNPRAIGEVFGIPLTDERWRHITDAVLPPDLDAALEAAARPGTLPELVVVPDGPVGGLPLAGLPLVGGRPLVECAAIALTPALSTLAHPTDHPDKRERPLSVVTHFDDHGLYGVEIERAAWRAQPAAVELRDTDSRDSLVTAMRTTPDVVVISCHGDTDGNPHHSAVLLRDGSVVSATAALQLRWPRTVVLGACWVAVTSSAPGRDPVGFPVACLARGAQSVIGGIAPIKSAVAARVLADFARALPTASSAVHALQLALSRRLQAEPHLRGQDPRAWAALTAWTNGPASPAARPLRPVTLRWRRDGTTQPADPGDRLGDEAAARSGGEPADASFAVPESATTYTSMHEAFEAGRYRHAADWLSQRARRAIERSAAPERLVGGTTDRRRGSAGRER